MKKQAQKTIMTIIIVFLLAMSTIAFVFLSNFPADQQQQTQVTKPGQSIVEGYLNETDRQIYLSNGFTIMEYHYYEGCCKEISQYIDFLPEFLDNQLMIQKIQDTEYYINIESFLGVKEKTTPQNNIELLSNLCDILAKPPVDCGLIKSETSNASANNESINKTN